MHQTLRPLSIKWKRFFIVKLSLVIQYGKIYKCADWRLGKDGKQLLISMTILHTSKGMENWFRSEIYQIDSLVRKFKMEDIHL